MFDQFNRVINYLRVSVTDRCNLRCTYCMPEKGVEILQHKDILSFDEIIAVIKTGVSLGITKVRITGGEPLVRKGIINLISMIADISEIEDLSMTTNGTLLSQFAQELKLAGLKRVNISLDTMSADEFSKITRGGDINAVFAGIKAAKIAGLTPIKLNCVIPRSGDETAAALVEEYAKSNNLEVRFIRQMDLVQGYFNIVKGGTGGDCANCNRLRLTANGDIKPCLFSNQTYNVRQLGIEKAYKMALNHKPERGIENTNGCFYNIGG